MAVKRSLSLPVTTVFIILLAVRVFSALYNNISDCDETYNYWEPAHFMLHGSGFETWEYSPVYAVRSYAYILLHVVPLFLLSSLSKIVQFYLLRVIFAIVCSACETYLYYVVKKRFNPQVSLWLFVFLTSSCGMFISSTAFLPSSFTMYCTMVSMAAWLDHKEHISIVAVALGSILGWPFAAVLGIPLAVNVVFSQRRTLFFVSWSLVSLIAIGGPVAYIDSRLYGKVVFAPLNIILYNVFGKGGPDLYGTEPWTYYFINGFLNMNFSFILCLICLPLVELKVISDSYIQKLPKQQGTYTATMFRPIVMTLLIWIAIFFTRPHKEERFLFPIYPLICLCAAISLHLIHELVPTVEYIFRLSKSWRSTLSDLVRIFTTCLLVTHAILGVSRVLALHHGYHAPLKVYYNLHSETLSIATQSLREVNLCVGKEWYRFPSSFFLPGEGTSKPRWNLRFIRSEFRGQLPKPYSTLPNATAVIPTDMNDMNKEEMSRYFSLGRCHYLIDSESAVPTTYEPRYHTNTAVWEPVYSFSFLDSKRSHRFFRAFYVPWFSNKFNRYVQYHLLHNTLS